MASVIPIFSAWLNILGIKYLWPKGTKGGFICSPPLQIDNNLPLSNFYCLPIALWVFYQISRSWKAACICAWKKICHLASADLGFHVNTFLIRGSSASQRWVIFPSLIIATLGPAEQVWILVCGYLSFTYLGYPVLGQGIRNCSHPGWDLFWPQGHSRTNQENFRSGLYTLVLL